MINNLTISTVAIDRYIILVPYFVKSIRRWNEEMMIYIITKKEELTFLEDFLILSNCYYNVKCIGAELIDKLSLDSATQGCALKLKIWDFLPANISETLFLDIDTLVIGDLFNELMILKNNSNKLFMARDTYIGFKEKMEFEFNILKYKWIPHFDNDGKRKYCNTGLILSSRPFCYFFNEVLNEWINYSGLTGTNPSIWDQNILNYCLDVNSFSINWDDIFILDEHFNALKEYDIKIDLDNSSISLGNKDLLLLHFNGGDIITKYARRAKSIQLFQFDK